ncbi:MAG: hypoxanthine phosphoribosyltransferase [Rhodothermia bacterium]|nr:MAG: hypoxanthine phosphoribosyltransferase [Rhodothermia bacterium]
MTANLLLHDDQTITLRGERFSVYLNSEMIQNRVAELGARITEDYKGKRPILIGVLNGAFMFLSDLMKTVRIDCEVDFVKLSSYGAEQISSGVVRELKKIDADLEGRHVLVVEDIVDTGLSMQYILDIMLSQNPESVKAITLLHKHEATEVDVRLDYVGFRIKNQFVVGYGLDYGQVGRNLPDIYVLDPHIDDS